MDTFSVSPTTFPLTFHPRCRRLYPMCYPHPLCPNWSLESNLHPRKLPPHLCRRGFIKASKQRDYSWKMAEEKMAPQTFSDTRVQARYNMIHSCLLPCKYSSWRNTAEVLRYIRGALHPPPLSWAAMKWMCHSSVCTALLESSKATENCLENNDPIERTLKVKYGFRSVFYGKCNPK